MLYELVSQPRSGSTYMFKVLEFYLNASWHQSIKAKQGANEPFNYWRDSGFDPENTVAGIKKLLDNSKNVVVKNHSLHLEKLLEHHPVVFNQYMNIPRKRIFLLRHDHFQKTLSLNVAAHYKRWTHELENIQPIYIEPDVFRYTCENLLKEYRSLKSMIKTDDIVVDYEKLEFWPRKDFYNLNLTNDDFDSLPKLKETRKNKPKDKTVVNLAELEHIYKTEFV